MWLTGKQRMYLRGLAHGMRPLVQIGKEGFSQAVAEAIDQALLDHELIKVSLGRPEEGKKALAEAVAQRCGAVCCGLTGHHAILYRPHPEEPEIVLPGAGPAAAATKKAG